MSGVGSTTLKDERKRMERDLLEDVEEADEVVLAGVVPETDEGLLVDVFEDVEQAEQHVAHLVRLQLVVADDGRRRRRHHRRRNRRHLGQRRRRRYCRVQRQRRRFVVRGRGAGRRRFAVRQRHLFSVVVRVLDG